MRLYAQTRARRCRQVLADLVAVVLVVAAVRFALAVRNGIMLLAEPGRKVEDAGGSLASGLNDAGNAASNVPLVGGILKKPLQSAAEASNGLSDAGQSMQDIVGRLANLTAFALIVTSVAFVLALWLPPRVRWIRRSALIRGLVDAPGGADLLALRALTGPVADLAAVSVPPGGLADAWRRGDESVIGDLSRVALRQAGLSP
ncbi:MULTISPECIES: hypothetical protein [unclassified Streptomyces]|uniref:hypothetical protein n=1 Tax=unclassified Streptomyces TaxID=2593676 RepID=UPI00214B972F|nr:MULTISPECIES: hypothetical protein [unclassified Streptomyces]MCX5610107.1 hypothetical protein [Streptomyces sp. NBC_00047]UUU43984.1 hypothetical protein JIW86_37360 [Streptomyces sp. NBC_00162]